MSPELSVMGTNAWSPPRYPCALVAYQAHTWGSAPTTTHHALLTQPEELLNLLGQEKLCAAHGTADFLQDWRAKGDGRGE